MNVLAKTKKYFPGPIKGSTGRLERHPSFQAFLGDWNTLLSSTTEESFDDRLEKMRKDHPPRALSYCSGTWLLWKEKLVAYWINKNYHFGVTVTSPIEGCHATLKSYLRRGNGDLRTVFERLQLFWDAQHSSFVSTAAQQKLRPKHTVNIPLFAAVLQHVHSFALEKILYEQAKLPAPGFGPLAEADVCSCTIENSHSLPCYHKIWERKANGGVILLEDIHRHWHYFRPERDVAILASLPLRPVLQPVRIKGKGRPRGALGGISRIAESSTRRHPSAFELPSSSAPTTLEHREPSIGQPFVVDSQASSTAIAMGRLKAGHLDLYEPGTQRERGYMCGMTSIYKDDSIEDAATIAAKAIQEEKICMIDGVEVFTQDAEFDLDNDFE